MCLPVEGREGGKVIVCLPVEGREGDCGKVCLLGRWSRLAAHLILQTGGRRCKRFMRMKLEK